MARFHSSILHGKFKPLLKTHGWGAKPHNNPWEDEWLFADHDWHGHGHRGWHGHHHKGGSKPSDQPQTTAQPDYAALLDEEARNVDGTGNNKDNPTLGSAGTDLLRKSFASYADDIGEPYTGKNPREISNVILDQDGLNPNSFGVSDLFTYFGQFIDHDIDLTPGGHYGETITFTHDDFKNDDNPEGTFGINRSSYVDGTGTDPDNPDNPREFPNVITSFVDGSNIYGSNAAVTSLLRAGGGTSPYLLTSDDDYAPTLGQLEDIYGDDLNPNNVGGGPLAAGGENEDLFIAGDVRANENIALTSMHTVWLREHNYQVDHLKPYMPDASDEELFQAAKLMAEAEYQNVVFNEYLPLLLGAENIPEYLGYNPDVDPSVSIEFSTAAFRLGHSQISPTLARIDEDGSESDAGNIGLFQAFFNPTQLLNGGIDALVRGLGAFKGQEIDENIVDDVRNMLFGGTDATPIDLGVFNILRNYDHGVPTLNEVREAYELPPLKSFAALTSDYMLQLQFESVYTDINQVELWVGGLAEDKFSGSQLGETFHEIVLDQFMNFRDGDRFYFEERMDDHPELLNLIKSTSFSDILLRVTGIDYFQDDAFIAHNRIGGDNGRDTLYGSDDPDLIIGFGGKDKLYGKDGDDDLYGGNSKDKLYGNDGRDVLFGEKGDDMLWGGKGNDLLDGGEGKDKLYGGNDDDTLYGRDGRDTLNGGKGNDVLIGGRDADTLIGGKGADTFVLSDFDAKDYIIDFEQEDIFDLTGLLDLLDTDGAPGLSQGDVDAAVHYSEGKLSVDDQTGSGFQQVAHIKAALGGFPDSISVLVDDDAGNEASFVV